VCTSGGANAEGGCWAWQDVAASEHWRPDALSKEPQTPLRVAARPRTVAFGDLMPPNPFASCCHNHLHKSMAFALLSRWERRRAACAGVALLLRARRGWQKKSRCIRICGAAPTGAISKRRWLLSIRSS
jgi:hypothetical protein